MPAEGPPQGSLPPTDQPSGGRETARRHFRFPVTLPILCRAARGEAGSSPRFWFSRTVNLSAVGTALLLPEPLAPGARVGLLLELEGRTLEFEATVQWVGAPIPPDQEVPHGLVFGTLRPPCPLRRCSPSASPPAAAQSGWRRACGGSGRPGRSRAPQLFPTAASSRARRSESSSQRVCTSRSSSGGRGGRRPPSAVGLLRFADVAVSCSGTFAARGRETLPEGAIALTGGDAPPRRAWGGGALESGRTGRPVTVPPCRPLSPSEPALPWPVSFPGANQKKL